MPFVKNDPRINRKGRPGKTDGAIFLRRHLKDTDLARKLSDMAKAGNETAIKLACSYLWGLPKQTIEQSGELTIYRAELPYRKAVGAPVDV
jgi:hypothetical protein